MTQECLVCRNSLTSSVLPVFGLSPELLMLTLSRGPSLMSRVTTWSLKMSL